MSELLVCGQPGSGPGRHMVSGRSVPAGQLVLREKALLTGPRLSSVLVCVECLERMECLNVCSRYGLGEL